MIKGPQVTRLGAMWLADAKQPSHLRPLGNSSTCARKVLNVILMGSAFNLKASITVWSERTSSR